MKPVSLCVQWISPHSIHLKPIVANANGNTRGYNFNASDVDLMLNVLQYHITPGTFTLQAGTGNGVTTIHELASTALSAELDKNQQQRIVFQISQDDNHVTNLILNQKVQTLNISEGYAVGNITMYFIDAVLGYPGTYPWEVGNIGALSQWRALEALAGGIEIDDYDGITIFAPTNAAWSLSKIINETQSRDLQTLYNNHVCISLSSSRCCV